MKRRRVLVGAGLALSTLVSGCLTDTGPTETGDTTTTTTQENGNVTETAAGEGATSSADRECRDRPAVAENIMIVLLNRTTTDQLVHVVLSMADDTLLDGAFTLTPDDHQPIYTGITETGQYDVSLTVEDGPTTSATLGIEEYDLEMGSNLIAEIHEDELRVMIEE